ncbi:uncharacterized protein METZ01_LOCUS55880 [marine metagenome]|uniref:Uncharacterized protein n=1 Tax=marine metagenome TaxID=408172 RepID=A0A381SGC3_9ZZZZ
MERPKSVKSITMRTGISKIAPRCGIRIKEFLFEETNTLFTVLRRNKNLTMDQPPDK